MLLTAHLLNTIFFGYFMVTTKAPHKIAVKSKVIVKIIYGYVKTWHRF
jgi:hypothetical protein